LLDKRIAFYCCAFLSHNQSSGIYKIESFLSKTYLGIRSGYKYEPVISANLLEASTEWGSKNEFQETALQSRVAQR